MKKSFWIVGTLILIIVVSLWGIFLKTNKVNIEFVKEADLCFLYGDTNTSHFLKGKEVELLKNIFNGKKMYSGNLSCGFSEDISIKFDSKKTFCIAQDTCPIVYWKEKKRYIKLSEEEKTQLYNLLEPYGFFFPCV